ncbi:hypothetical protein CCMSSC00406_0006850 [Pleurotus cornucopiae]|uniref:Uncharacterized protein n=1 Tax=Pleurotus cornucopiae TaxID=5321 RepID=A0ACB7J0V5_PLECO|nr:hypothetical protein CCMSSC00406_0006850 [Pleurotus cornucopiae]
MSDSTTKPQVALVGAHSDSFVQALQAADFNVEQCSSILDPATPSSIAVLALTGDDHTLSVSDIDEKLRAGTVLALFGPSRELLETIHEATNTPIDIPSLELADGLPLLVYMVNGVVHIDTNNFPCEYKIDELVRNATPGDAKAPEEEEPESFSVLPVKLDPVEQTIRSILSAVSETLDAKDSTSILEPPPDVKAFIQIFDLYWFVRYYAYATGADCRGKTPSEFTEAGGVVYTLVLDQGYLKRSSDSAPRYKGPTEGFCGYYLVDCHRTGHHSENSSMRVVSYQPSGLTSSSGTTYNHSIRFEQDMQMLGNGGNSLHTFKARYSKDYSLPKFQQHEVLNRSVGVDFSVDYNDYYDHWADPRFKSPQWWNVFEQRGGYDTKLVRDDLPRDDIPINGLTVFSSSVGRHTLTSRWYTEFAAFKSNSWWTTDDRDDGSSIISAPRIEKLQLDLVLDDGTPPLPNIDDMFSVLPSPLTSHWRARSSIDFHSHFEFGMRYADIDLCILIYSSETHDADSAPIVEAKISFPVRGGSGSDIAAQAFSGAVSGTLFKPDGGAPGSQTGGMGTPLDLPLPSLQTIYIIPKYALEDSEIAKMLETLAALRGTLHARKEVCPIEVLKLGRGMELPEEELGLLREIGVRVELLDHGVSAL